MSIGFYISQLNLGFCMPTVTDGDEDFIFFYKALCVLSYISVDMGWPNI